MSEKHTPATSVHSTPVKSPCLKKSKVGDGNNNTGAGSDPMKIKESVVHSTPVKVGNGDDNTGDCSDHMEIEESVACRAC